MTVGGGDTVGMIAVLRGVTTAAVGVLGVISGVVGVTFGVVAVVVAGCSEAGWIAAAGWLAWWFLCPLLTASAVPAAATAITVAAAMAALAGAMCRSLLIRCTVVVPGGTGGALAGHSPASKRAASPRWERPRRSQSVP